MVRKSFGEPNIRILGLVNPNRALREESGSRLLSTPGSACLTSAHAQLHQQPI